MFDADGDRFYRLDYDAESDTILVLSGDETAVHQARHLAPPAPGTLYINTVESDLNAARKARSSAYTPLLTGVGDKWVLRQAADAPERYGIGSEETGHNISRGVLQDAARATRPDVFLGNGLKSALNTFVATRGLTPREAWRPFDPRASSARSMSTTPRKEMLAPGSEVFRRGRARSSRSACETRTDRHRGRDPRSRRCSTSRLQDGDRMASAPASSCATPEPRRRPASTCADRRRADGESSWCEPARQARALPRAHDEEPRPPDGARGAGGARRRWPWTARCRPTALPIPDDVHRERLLEEMANKEKVIRLRSRRVRADGAGRQDGGDAQMSFAPEGFLRSRRVSAQGDLRRLRSCVGRARPHRRVRARATSGRRCTAPWRKAPTSGPTST